LDLLPNRYLFIPGHSNKEKSITKHSAKGPHVTKQIEVDVDATINSDSGSDMGSKRGHTIDGNSVSRYSASENRDRDPLAVDVDVTDNSEIGINTGTKLGGGQVKMPKKQKLVGKRLTMGVNIEANRDINNRAPSNPRR
jgi:hypothetical protein